MVAALKALVSNYLSRHSMRIHRSRIGWRMAPLYTRYLDRCRREAAASVTPRAEVAAAAETFKRDGIASFGTERTERIARAMSAKLSEREAAGETVWLPSGEVGNTFDYAGDAWIDFPELAELFATDLGDFLKSHFRTDFKILHGVLYRTINDDTPVGSQLWHSDGGPGICVNVMYYLHDTTPANGTLEALPWPPSLDIYRQEKKAEYRGELARYPGSRRDRMCAFYGEKIEQSYKDRVLQPFGKAGLVVPFLNNTLHRGGFPSSGHSRTAIVFHCYPSHRKTNLDRYNVKGIKKTVPYPKDPSVDF